MIRNMNCWNLHELLKLSIFSVLALVICAEKGAAEVHHCNSPYEIELSLENASSLRGICTSATKALEFLAGYDLYPNRTIRLNIVESSILSEGYDAFGSYNLKSEVIDLMSYRAILNYVHRPEMYGQPFDEIHYSGAIAHEVAHAVMHQNLKSKHISQAPQEYLAHATQLAVLPEDRRNAIIKAMGVEPWESGDAISDIYMAMEPGKFAVKSYLHLTTSKQPKTFITILLKSNWFYVYVP